MHRLYISKCCRIELFFIYLNQKKKKIKLTALADAWSTTAFPCRLPLDNSQVRWEKVSPEAQVRSSPSLCACHLLQGTAADTHRARAGVEWAGQPFLRCPIPGSYSEGEISAVQLEF